MRDEKRHGASGRALREAAIRYAASLEANDPDLPRAWEWLSH